MTDQERANEIRDLLKSLRAEDDDAFSDVAETHAVTIATIWIDPANAAYEEAGELVEDIEARLDMLDEDD